MERRKFVLKRACLTIWALLLAAPLSYAQESGPLPPDDGMGHPPPPWESEAREGKRRHKGDSEFPPKGRKKWKGRMEKGFHPGHKGRWKKPPMMLMDERFEKMLPLATLSEDQVIEHAKKWPHFEKVPEQGRERMLERMKKFRKRFRREALHEAKQMELKLEGEKENEFIRAFWQKRIEVDKKLKAELEPRRKELMKQAREDLKKQFGPSKDD